MRVQHSGYHSAGSCYTGGGGGEGIVYHTDTTRSHVGGHHDGTLARLELVQDPITLVLLLVTVDS
jgi:hypothetical protein